MLPLMNSASGSILGESGRCGAEDAGENPKHEQQKAHGSLLFASWNPSAAGLFPAFCAMSRPLPRRMSPDYQCCCEA